MTSEEVENFRQGRPYTSLTDTPHSRSARLTRYLARPGDYVVLLDNRLESQAVEAHLKLELIFDDAVSSFEPRTVPRGRRNAIVAASLGFFFITAAWAGLRIRGAWTRRASARDCL